MERLVAALRHSISSNGFMFTNSTRNNPKVAEFYKFLRVRLKLKSAMKVKTVTWLRLQPGWTKVNIDGAVLGCGGIFRMFRGFPEGCYAFPQGTKIAMFAKLMGVYSYSGTR